MYRANCGTMKNNTKTENNIILFLFKYSFFILVIGISFLVLLFSVVKQKVRKWFK